MFSTFSMLRMLESVHFERSLIAYSASIPFFRFPSPPRSSSVKKRPLVARAQKYARFRFRSLSLSEIYHVLCFLWINLSILTASIFKTHVWKSPHVSISYAETNAREQKLNFSAPTISAFLFYYKDRLFLMMFGFSLQSKRYWSAV